ncbi:hypothetical protein Plhal304r1_c032g0103581 [Plasmopara halstedii]
MKLSTSLILVATAVTVTNGGNPQYLRQPDSGSLETIDSGDYDKSSKYASLNEKGGGDDLSVDLGELFHMDVGNLDGSDLEINIMSLIGSGSNQVPADKLFAAIAQMEGGLNTGSLDDTEDIIKSVGLADDWNLPKGASKGDLNWLNDDGSLDKLAGKGGFADYDSKSEKTDDELNSSKNLFNDDDAVVNDDLATKASKGDTEWLEGDGNADVSMGKGGYVDFDSKSAGVPTKTGGQSKSVGPASDDNDLTLEKGPYKGDELTWLDGSEDEVVLDDAITSKLGDMVDKVLSDAGVSFDTSNSIGSIGDANDDDDNDDDVNDDDDVNVGKPTEADDVMLPKDAYSDDALADKGGYADFATKSAGASTKTSGPADDDDDAVLSSGLDDDLAEKSDDTATKASKSTKSGTETPYAGKIYADSGLGLIGDDDQPKKSNRVPPQEDVDSALDDPVQIM